MSTEKDGVMCPECEERFDEMDLADNTNPNNGKTTCPGCGCVTPYEDWIP